MKKVIPFAIVLLFFSNAGQVQPGPETKNTVIPVSVQASDLHDYLLYWYDINTGIDVDQTSWIDRRASLEILMPLIRECLLDLYGREPFLGSDVAFPVKGGHLYDVGGKNGSGYRFGHRGHDIFVKDSDYDCLNDATGEEYFALAMHSAVVLSVYDNWRPDSERVAGNHVWLYNPEQDIVLYYAHLKRILVKPGDIVAEGAPIAAIGRTGLNAYPHRSPTHVHVMEMRYNGDGLRSYNFWDELVQSEKTQGGGTARR